ncbi:head-tail adaptor protein [Citreimonas salinaria]|uniref:Head-tail adaptor n=1 Tax=Citreimonas salinaria TaxID=321339 RepID=A0A1H3H120_9RHOB|nr:head-tail adaptor protein [Citreimonas salinaria]SDY08454.1 head-tail adaptor [Citreimonas salinaria]
MSRVLLNRPLVLEAGTRLEDGAGGFVHSWAPLGTLWAEVRPRTGRMTSDSDAGSLSVARFQVIVRAAPEGHSARPVAGHRFRMGERVFRIDAVTEDEPAIRYLLCQCVEEIAS